MQFSETNQNQSAPIPLEAAVRLFSAMAKGTRLAILQALIERPRTAQDLAADLGEAQPDVSGELQVLTEAKLVKRSMSGPDVYYEIRDATICRLLELADKMVRSGKQNP